MKLFKPYYWIFLITLIAGLIRFWDLTSVPPSLNSDEVAIGYNAYSILLTGKDEYGVPYPSTFRSFDDYKMPLYIYFVTGSMKLFGVGDFAVRFPSAFFGTLSILCTYLLVKELFKKESIALLSAFLLAISPWSVFFSRSGYEANVAVFFIVSGTYFFLKGRQHGYWLLISAMCFSLSIWTYLTPRLFVPLLLVGLLIIYGKEILKQKIWSVIAIIIGLCMLLPIIRMTISPEGRMRASGVSSFANPDIFKQYVARSLYLKTHYGSIVSAFTNRRIAYAQTFLRGYFSHFDLNFLFLDKSIDKYRAPDMGLIYLYELPFIALGIYLLVRRLSSGSLLLFWWLLSAPVAAAFTLQFPHPVRTLVFLPVFSIFAAVGLVRVWDKFKTFRIPLLLIMSISFIYFAQQYFVFLPIERGEEWYAQRKEMTERILSRIDDYDEIYVSNALDVPYIFYLYYSKIKPADYLMQGGTVTGGFLEQNNHVGKVMFRSISSSLKDPLKKQLFIGLPSEVFKSTQIIETLHYQNMLPAMVFFE